MADLRNNNISRFIYNYFPVILLFVSVMNHFDFNNLQIKYFAFNFSYILIFFYTLKRKDAIGYVSLFVAGLFNDVIVGLPMGISSIFFLLLSKENNIRLFSLIDLMDSLNFNVNVELFCSTLNILSVS